MSKTKPAPTPDPRDAVIERILDLYRDARRGAMGSHTHWGRIIVTKLRTLADVDVSRLDDFEGDGEEAEEFAALVQRYVTGRDRHLARLAADTRMPWYAMDDAERAAVETVWRQRARDLCDSFVKDVHAFGLDHPHGNPGPCTWDEGIRWYEGDQLDVDGDGDGSDPLEPKPWRYQRMVEEYDWHAPPDKRTTLKRKWGAFGVWARLTDDRHTNRERRATLNYSGEPRTILGWTIERTGLTGEVPCPRCNHGDERKTPEIIRETCPFCDASGYFHNDAQVVVYVRNK